MKKFGFFLSLIMILIVVATPSAFAGSRTQEEVRTKNSEFKRIVEIEVEKYDGIRINNIYLEHRRKIKKSGEKDYLYVKGSLKNLRRTILAGAYARANFYDAQGKLLTTEQEVVIPRILRQSRRNLGHFTITIPYDTRIALCKLEAIWPGKEDE